MQCDIACRWDRRGLCRAVHPAAEPRGVSFQAITANQHSDTKVGSGGGLSIVQSGGPMVGGFTEGEVAVADRNAD